MLFNSPHFIFLFLPITLSVFFALARRDRRSALVWLTAASVFFYAWWNPPYVVLILASMLFNYAVGAALSRNRGGKRLLALGIAANLILLGYYKYANFFVDNLNAVIHSDLRLEPVLLPLGISFFTFQQVAYLVDAHRGETKEYDVIQYGLFVTFYPQLIAGPIVHHAEILPQFDGRRPFRFRADDMAAGVTVFLCGLFKKVVIADTVAVYASPLFDYAALVRPVTFCEAWCGVLAYALQIYFDFSGYSDMAVGLGRMVGIRIPVNFDAPYRATSPIEFWRRWHMTLSRFLRDYLYIPLGGGRRGTARRYVNLMATMLLGGLWHGASWNCVIWGGLHGLLLSMNHVWRGRRGPAGGTDRPGDGPFSTWAGRLLTFLAVCVAWVFFRSRDLTAAFDLLGAMAGMNGVVLPRGYAAFPGTGVLAALGVRFGDAGLFLGRNEMLFLGGLLSWCWFAPTTQTWTAAADDADAGVRTGWPAWRPSRGWAVAIAAASFVTLLRLSGFSEFLYFQF